MCYRWNKANSYLSFIFDMQYVWIDVPSVYGYTPLLLNLDNRGYLLKCQSV